jgi:hypothetical protein
MAAGLRPPLPERNANRALLSLADRDKQHLPDLASALAAAGYVLCATRGTAVALRALGHDVEEVARVGETGVGRTVVDAIGSGEVALVVNTPSPESRPVRDAGAIRRAALSEGILCLTSIDTAVAAARALDPVLAVAIPDVRPLDEWRRLPSPDLSDASAVTSHSVPFPAREPLGSVAAGH